MTTIATIAAKEIALSLCKGSYQTSLVHGAASWSGSDLKGTAARYGGRYRESRQSLIDACKGAGLRIVVSAIGNRGKMIATILTHEEARRIPVTTTGGDNRIEGRALEQRIYRVKKRLAAEERKRARELALDEAALSLLAA
ncbi:hypothetical protein [Methylobacterium ajmalii]|jgi:hypothetical protein|uniref:hypothetical protein n=1 Tax=Methylobacterium ajmalii TaxID=2738439 RepID=UPI00190B930F|nr:hypothetical protein [Methylobacterium ajmalii]MBK3398050.1 hypothetical protein [Methylobacterium ajmalii]MBK3406918.1 hypothetical protein [Methylobacterium ajmalii]MBK3422628.1 hypothetical protein [Methylobacterium ajmalii]MBZ6416721.1 hypothetical protein [Methylobacterium sp.]